MNLTEILSRLDEESTSILIDSLEEDIRGQIPDCVVHHYEKNITLEFEGKSADDSGVFRAIAAHMCRCDTTLFCPIHHDPEEIPCSSSA